MATGSLEEEDNSIEALAIKYIMATRELTEIARPAIRKEERETWKFYSKMVLLVGPEATVKAVENAKKSFALLTGDTA